MSSSKRVTDSLSCFFPKTELSIKKLYCHFVIAKKYFTFSKILYCNFRLILHNELLHIFKNFILQFSLRHFCIMNCSIFSKNLYCNLDLFFYKKPEPPTVRLLDHLIYCSSSFETVKYRIIDHFSTLFLSVQPRNCFANVTLRRVHNTTTNVIACGMQALHMDENRKRAASVSKYRKLARPFSDVQSFCIRFGRRCSK